MYFMMSVLAGKVVEMPGYFNIKALVFIAALALIWPLQQLSMALIFEPIMMAI